MKLVLILFSVVFGSLGTIYAVSFFWVMSISLSANRFVLVGNGAVRIIDSGAMKRTYISLLIPLLLAAGVVVGMGWGLWRRRRRIVQGAFPVV